MNEEQIKKQSKKLSWLLRHGANEAGLDMDAAGFAAVADVKRVLRISDEVLEIVVRENNKSRLEVLGQRIRAVQGHSLAGTPVTLDGLEASWQRHTGDASVWHGTNVAALSEIAKEGILPMARTHVHLAETLDSHVGKRANVAVMLEISPKALGLPIFISPNGVLLVRQVPVTAIVGLKACTKGAVAKEPVLRALFGL